MPPGPLRLVAALAWLFALWLAATIAESIAAARVGHHAGTSFGAARAEFEASWGGRIEMSPPAFALEYTRMVTGTNRDGEFFERPELKEEPLVPRSAMLDTRIVHGTRQSGWHHFQAFEVHQAESYTVRNTAPVPGALLLTIDRPDTAAIVYDLRVEVDGVVFPSPALERPLRLAEQFLPGAEVGVRLTQATHGVDVFRWKLSDWKDVIVPRLDATFSVNTNQFALWRFGLPHTRTWDGSEARVVFGVADFASNQDLGISFVGDRQDIDRVREIVFYSPAATALYLALLLVWSQVRGARFGSFHFAFAAVVQAFYFLFLAYMIRYISLGAAMAAGTFLTLLMFAATIPPSMGRSFALGTVLPYLLLHTLGFSGLFMLPAFTGVAFLAFVFVLLLSVMAPLARADFKSWPLLSAPARDTPPTPQ